MSTTKNLNNQPFISPDKLGSFLAGINKSKKNITNEINVIVNN